MAEYIEREALMNEIHRIGGHNLCGWDTIGVKALVDRQPSADVVEVVHGHNKTSMHPVDEFWCSVCGFCCADYTETKYDEDGDYTYSCECEFEYCPKCGAKMDGDKNG
jgi:hypothetical protein